MTWPVQAAKSQLAGRRLLAVEGPYGFGLKAIPLGDYALEEGISASVSLPLSLIRTEFSLAKARSSHPLNATT